MIPSQPKPSDNLFSQALKVAATLNDAPVDDRRLQWVNICSTTPACNDAILNIIQVAYFRAIGDLDNPEVEMPLIRNNAQNLTRFGFAVPKPMERLPVNVIQENIRALQRELLGELESAKPYILLPDQTRYYKLPYDHVPGTDDDKLDHTYTKHQLVTALSQAYGVDDHTINDNTLLQMNLPRYLCMIYPEERDAVLQHERMPERPRPH